MSNLSLEAIYHPAAFSPEDKLLLYCAAASIDEKAHQAILEITGKKLDWQYVYRRAFEHKLTPLVYRALSSICPDAVPANLLKDMRVYCETNQRYALMLSTELLHVLKLLREKHISAIPFKGPILALLAYGELAARYYVDLDILVQEADIDAARDVLAQAGYMPPQDKEYEKLLRKLDYSYTLHNPRNKIVVELHWRIAPTYLSFPFDNTGLWQRKSPVVLLDTTIDTFSPEDTFLILCMHGTKHYWHRLSWLADVTEFLAKHPALNWTYIVQQAKRLRIYRMLLLTVLLTHHLQDAAVPGDLLTKAYRDPKVLDLARWVVKWMFGDKIIPVARFAGYAFQFNSRESWWDKFLYLRIKQPMILENHQPIDGSQIPDHDRILYFALVSLRVVKRTVVNPIKKLVNKLQA